MLWNEGCGELLLGWAAMMWYIYASSCSSDYNLYVLKVGAQFVLSGALPSNCSQTQKIGMPFTIDMYKSNDKN